MVGQVEQEQNSPFDFGKSEKCAKSVRGSNSESCAKFALFIESKQCIDN